MLSNPQSAREYGRGARAKAQAAPVSFINLFDSTLVKFSRAARVRQLVGAPTGAPALGSHAPEHAGGGTVPALRFEFGDETKIEIESQVPLEPPQQRVQPQSSQLASRTPKVAVAHAPMLVEK